MGFACWGQLGQLWQPLLMRQPLAPQRSNATRCSVSGESFGEAEWFGRAKEPWRPASIILVSYRPLAADRVAGEIAPLCIPAVARRWKRSALVPCSSSACVTEP